MAEDSSSEHGTMATPHDCPNCGKEGELFENNPPKRYCDDRACPVVTYNWEHDD
jgi:hypothetical protein